MFSTTIITLALAALSSVSAAPARFVVRAPGPADQQAYLDAHNSFRAQHGAAPLVWNQTLADAGARHASKCKFEHSGGSVGPFGENLAAGTNEGPAQAVESWNSEISKHPASRLYCTIKLTIRVLVEDYDSNKPEFSAATGHFTQVVWKNTQQLGCAQINCPPGAIFDAKFGETPFHICEYFPPGNFQGQFK
jgi:pathogenesis-related protein 1